MTTTEKSQAKEDSFRRIQNRGRPGWNLYRGTKKSGNSQKRSKLSTDRYGSNSNPRRTLDLGSGGYEQAGDQKSVRRYYSNDVFRPASAPQLAEDQGECEESTREQT